jgi:putative salt-induced outer membrane protein
MTRSADAPGPATPLRRAFADRPSQRNRCALGLGTALLLMTTVIQAQEPEPVAVVSGSSAVGADAAGSQASDKLFAVYNIPDPDAPGGWNGRGLLGYSATTGNSETSNVNASFLIAYTSYPWRHYFSADANFGENQGDTNTERWAAGYKPEYFFSRRTFAFLFLGYDHDKFADIDARYSATLGIGHVIWKNDNNILIGELGAGYRQTNYVSNIDDNGEAVGRAALHYTGKITRNTSFSQDLTTLFGSKNTFVESISALQVAMTDTLALSVNYTVRYNSFAPPGFENTDTFTSVNLVAAF